MIAIKAIAANPTTIHITGLTNGIPRGLEALFGYFLL